MVFGLPASKTGDAVARSAKFALPKLGWSAAYPTLVVSGGARPWTPDTLTSSSPICSILMP